ncbi:hypothetical protein EYC80_000174 [Monilinia laxa]|uniref:60S ribosomal protein L41 n=1 Tax=Monilinia laxa TaxID=61186 RepID=A0A5N6K9Z1_MONLA|nr:hypothetical protein EYC80_000174 [Monilinia laxa]
MRYHVISPKSPKCAKLARKINRDPAPYLELQSTELIPLLQSFIQLTFNMRAKWRKKRVRRLKRKRRKTRARSK